MSTSSARAISVVCVVLFFWPSILFSVDLGHMARLAIENSIEMRRLEHKIRVSEIGAREKWGQFTPTVNLSASRTHTDQEKPSDVDKRESDYSISVTQALYQPDLLLNHEEAILNIDISSMQLQQVRENLLKEVLSTTLDICRLRSRLNVTEHSLDFVRKTVEIQGRLLKSGYASEISLKEAEVELARSHKDYQELDLQLQLRLLTLANLTGEDRKSEDFSAINRRLQIIDSDMFSKNPAHWAETSFRNNSQLAFVRVSRKMNRISKDRGNNQFKPRVNLTLSYEQSEAEALVDYRVDESSIELSFSMSFSPVTSYYQVQRYDLETQVLVIEEEKIKKDLQNRINHLLRSIELKRRNIDIQNQWKTKQKLIVEMYRKGLKQKHILFSQFLDSSRKYNESQIDLVQTIFGIWEDRAELLYLSGQLTIEKIDELKRELDLKANPG